MPGYQSPLGDQNMTGATMPPVPSSDKPLLVSYEGEHALTWLIEALAEGKPVDHVPNLTWYNGSKGAAVTLTKSMAVELAPQNIRVNAICPVAGETPMLGEFLGGKVTNEMHDKFVATVPIGRLSTPTDIANAALFLASDEAEFITGVALEVDGGRCI